MGSSVIGQMVSGTIDHFNGGMRLSHQLLFVLGDFRPSELELIPLGPRRRTRLWIPISDETMLEDGLLMLGLCAFRPPALIERAASLTNEQHKRSRKVSKRFPQIEPLREACRLIEDTNWKVVLTLWSGAAGLRAQCRVLAKYKLNIEVCRTAYRREYLAWRGCWTTAGTLEWPDRE